MKTTINWSEVLQAAFAPTLKTIEQINEQVIKQAAAQMSCIYKDISKENKAFNISNLLVKELVEEEQKEICIITTEQFDIDNIITTLEFLEICKRANKSVQHRALLSYKNNNLKLSKSLENRDLNDISFYALDCELRMKKYNVYNIHNHLNELEFTKHNISANCFLYNKSKSYINTVEQKQAISTAMSVVSSRTSAERVAFISKADSCGYSIFLNKYSTDKGFKYNNLFEQEKEKYSCYKDFREVVQQLKSNINSAFKSTYKDNFYTLVEQENEQSALSAAELEIMRDYISFISGEYYIAEQFSSSKKDITLVSKTINELLEAELQRLNISREELINVSFIDVSNAANYIRIQYLIDEQKQKERERKELAKMLENII